MLANNVTSKDVTKAKQLWAYVLDTSKVTGSASNIASAGLNKIIKQTSERSFKLKPKMRPEVITVAKFIGNMEPAYKNSDGRWVELAFLRARTDLPQEDIDYVCEKLEEVVKPYISVGNETAIVGNKLKVKSTMQKKKLIHAAINHLLQGSEIFKNPNDYHEVKARSLFKTDIKTSYAWLIGLALALRYKSVIDMMEDLCLKFIDQTESVERTGMVVYYDGAVRRELL